MNPIKSVNFDNIEKNINSASNKKNEMTDFITEKIENVNKALSSNSSPNDNKLDVSGEYIGPGLFGFVGWAWWSGTIHFEHYSPGIEYDKVYLDASGAVYYYKDGINVLTKHSDGSWELIENDRGKKMWFYPDGRYTDYNGFDGEKISIIYKDDGSIDGIVDLSSGEKIGFYYKGNDNIYINDNSGRIFYLNERCLKDQTNDKDIYYDYYGHITRMRNGDTYEYVTGINQRTQYEYDSNGNLTEVREINKSVDSIEYEGKKYDDVSQVIRRDRNNNIIDVTYNIFVNSSGSEGPFTIILVCDKNGKVISEKHSSGPKKDPYVYIDWEYTSI